MAEASGAAVNLEMIYDEQRHEVSFEALREMFLSWPLAPEPPLYVSEAHDLSARLPQIVPELTARPLSDY